MAGVSLYCTLDSSALRLLERVADRITDLRPLHDNIGAAMVTSVQNRFERQEDPDGRRWLPSPHGLQDGGHLLDSITHNAMSDKVEVGSSNEVYAAIHQFGGIIKPKTARALHFVAGGGHVTVKQVEIPARPYLGVNAADKKTIHRILELFIAEATDE